MEGPGSRALRRLEGRPSGAIDTVRLFFALWPDDAARSALANLARVLYAQCGGRQVPESNIHLTLTFLGSVRASLVPALQQLAGEITGSAVVLALDAVEYRRRNSIVWIGARDCPPALSRLVARLIAEVRALGIRTESRNYKPHVTLLRGPHRGPQVRELDAIEWHSAEFALVQSVTREGTVAYDVIGRWPLAARD
jgi:2'-5' RNA ligase